MTWVPQNKCTNRLENLTNHTDTVEVIGSNPVGASEFFLGFICNFTTAKISFTSIHFCSLSAVHSYYLYHIHFTSYRPCYWPSYRLPFPTTLPTTYQKRTDHIPTTHDTNNTDHITNHIPKTYWPHTNHTRHRQYRPHTVSIVLTIFSHATHLLLPFTHDMHTPWHLPSLYFCELHAASPTHLFESQYLSAPHIQPS